MQTLVATLIPMAAFALATSASPGPVNIVSALSGARFGALSSFRYVLGATVAFVAILLLMGTGLGTVIVENAALAKGMALAGAGYILHLAWRIFRIEAADLGVDGADVAAAPPGFLSGVITQGSNPKAWIVALSAVSVYVANAPDYGLRLAVFSAVFFVICLLSLWSWALAGSLISAASGRVVLFTRAMAVLLAVSVVYFVVTVVVG